MPAMGAQALGGRSDPHGAGNGFVGHRYREYRVARNLGRTECSTAQVVWVINVYQTALVASLLPLGTLGEIVGHERIYVSGLLLFTLASLACASARSLDRLLIARTLQGLGASGITSVNTALVRFVYPGRMHGRGFGHNALVVTTTFTLRDRNPDRTENLAPTPRAKHDFDFSGAILASACLGFFVVGIGSAAHQAWPALVVIELFAALLLGSLLTRRQAGHPAPMLPTDLFRRPLFALSAATAVCSFAVQRLAFIFLLLRRRLIALPG